MLKNFKYCFSNTFSYPAILKINPLKKKIIFKEKFSNLKIKIIKVKHGMVMCNAFIVNNKCAYLSDVSKIYSKDYKYFKNLKYFIIDCLRYKMHPSHLNLDEALKLASLLKPKKTILTNLHSDLDYRKLKKILPKNIIPAYDGMSFNL